MQQLGFLLPADLKTLLSTSKKVAAAVALAAMLMSVLAPVAFADSKAIYQACRVGGSLDGYSIAELNEALRDAPADAAQYSACDEVIQAAIIDKATKKIPGGGKDLKSKKKKLTRATVSDLTTTADRKKAAAKVERATKLDAGRPLGRSSDPAIATAPGQTLSSSAAPTAPTALLIGVLGLALLAGADLAARVTRRPPQ
jgi:hypothetical protein